MKIIRRMRFVAFIAGFLICGGISGQIPFQGEMLEKISGRDRLTQQARFTAPVIAQEDGYDLTYQRCIWQIDPAVRYIKGSITTYFRPTSAGFDTIVFSLNEPMFIDSVRYHKIPLAYVHEEGVVSIALPGLLPIGLTDSVTVFYQGAPAETGFGSFVDEEHNGTPVLWTLSEPYGAADWWPCKNNLTDKADSADLLIVTPAAYRAASNGILVSETVNGGNRIAWWKHRYPMVTYNFCLAVTNYASFTHEVPFGATTVPVLHYVYPEDSASAYTQSLGIIPVMQLFDSLFGTYPFAAEKYGQCQISWGGGMEHQTFTFMGSFDHELMAHELAHSWFGNKITCGSWEDIWLNEGFASYLSGLTYEHMFDGYWWMPFKRNRLSKIISQPGGSVWCDDTTSVDRIFDSRLSYAKGAMILHQLRWILGDSVFFPAVNNYLQDPLLAYGFARTPDLVAHLESVSGLELDWYFNDWYKGQGFPSYQVNWHQQDSEVTITLNQTTSHPSIQFFPLPVPIRLKNAVSDTTVRLQHTFSGETFTVAIPFQADSLLFDPDLWLISANNSVTSIPEQNRYEKVKVYPNPATDEATVVLRDPGSWDELILHDLSGRVIRSFSISGRSPFSIDLQQIPAGFYLLRLCGRSETSSLPLLVRQPE